MATTRRSGAARTLSPRERIRVVVRVRPPIAEDVDLALASGDDHYEECVDEDTRRAAILLRKPYFDTREFMLDMVLGREATQSETYEAVGRRVVDDVLEGYNGTLLAYGQTGTGKSARPPLGRTMARTALFLSTNDRPCTVPSSST